MGISLDLDFAETDISDEITEGVKIDFWLTILVAALLVIIIGVIIRLQIAEAAIERLERRTQTQASVKGGE